MHLSGDDLAGYLQGLPSEQLAQFEIYATPPAQFDAQGAAVINIITRKAKKQVLNLTLNGGFTQATYGSYTSGATVNYRSGKLNLYGSYGYVHRTRTKDQDDYIIFTAPGDTSRWQSPGHTVYRSQSHNYNLGLDYQLGPHQLLGVLLNGSNTVRRSTSFAPTTVTHNAQLPYDSLLQTQGLITGGSHRYAVNVNYTLLLDTAGQSLSLDADYVPYRSTSDQYVSNTTLLPDGSQASPLYAIYTPSAQQINIYSGKADYTFKKRTAWKLTTGLKYSSIQATSLYSYNNIRQRQEQPVSDRGDHYEYTENTLAGYLMFNGSQGALTFNGGLRGEYTRISGYSVTLDTLNRTRYVKVFPSLSAVYQQDPENQLSATYAYRIQRPEYSRLNPLRIYKTPYNILSGNPALLPAFAHNLEISYFYHRQYTFTAFYSATHQLFSNATVQDNASRLFYDIQQNVGSTMRTGFRLSAALQPASWWEFNLLAEGYLQRDHLRYLQTAALYRKAAFDGQTSQRFTLQRKRGLALELSGFYYSDASEGLFRGGSYSEVDAGLKMNVWAARGTVKLAAADLFLGNTSRYRVSYANQNNGFFQKNDTRSLTVSFTYRLGTAVKAARSRETASEEERKRVS